MYLIDFFLLNILSVFCYTWVCCVRTFWPAKAFILFSFVDEGPQSLWAFWTRHGACAIHVNRRKKKLKRARQYQGVCTGNLLIPRETKRGERSCACEESAPIQQIDEIKYRGARDKCDG